MNTEEQKSIAKPDQKLSFSDLWHTVKGHKKLYY